MKNKPKFISPGVYTVEHDVSYMPRKDLYCPSCYSKRLSYPIVLEGTHACLECVLEIEPITKEQMRESKLKKLL